MQLCLPEAKKRKAADEETGAKDQSASSSSKVDKGDKKGVNGAKVKSGKELGKGLGDGDLAKRLERLEALAVSHDVAIRRLENWNTRAWLLSEDDTLGSRLLDQLASYNNHRPQKGGHPWGPARRALALELIKWLLDEDDPQDIRDNGAFAAFHQSMTKIEEVDTTSVDFLTVKRIDDKRVLLRLRPKQSDLQAWAGAMETITRHIEAYGGEEKLEPAPAGPLVRHMMRK
eukprot:TRINITY_DN14316_c0_g1_i2.p2 TRINITY_DN14316_c0_g1~~TRINITY_DN14316_c0_g1_i2.p2  ORF type:complete len:230 (-),score=65.39 TRINITY_DN14316_c0_g1_i2:834-1523(-)